MVGRERVRRMMKREANGDGRNFREMQGKEGEGEERWGIGMGVGRW